jgi:hypothetical protein
MSIAAAIASASVGAVTVAVAVLLMRHCDKTPAKAHSWIRRLDIILMWAAGAVFAASGLEGLLQAWTGDITGFIGGPYVQIINVGLVIGALVLLTGTIVALIWDPDDAAAFTALLVPLVLGLVAAGHLHAAYAVTVAPGEHITAAINHWLAG